MAAILPLILKRVDGLLRERFVDAVRAKYLQGELKVSIGVGINANLSTGLLEADVVMSVPTTMKFRAHDEIEVAPDQMSLPMDIPPKGDSLPGVATPAVPAVCPTSVVEEGLEGEPVPLPEPEPEPPKKKARKSAKAKGDA